MQFDIWHLKCPLCWLLAPIFGIWKAMVLCFNFKATLIFSSKSSNIQIIFNIHSGPMSKCFFNCVLFFYYQILNHKCFGIWCFWANLGPQAHVYVLWGSLKSLSSNAPSDVFGSWSMVDFSWRRNGYFNVYKFEIYLNVYGWCLETFWFWRCFLMF